ncbi:MAG: hypothetical protein AB1540_04615 [Bdellovibrionota bacterium]
MNPVFAFILLFFACIFSPDGIAAPKKKNDLEFQNAIRQAKLSMSQGNRRQAILHLDKARELGRSKVQLKEVSSRRILFAEQFVTSASFQKFQEAKGLSEVKRWDECIREIDSMEVKDQDNLLVLRLKSECQSGLNLDGPAAKSLNTILELIPADVGATYGLIELDLDQKRYDQGLSRLNGIEPASSAEMERYAILKARLLEGLARPLEAAEILKKDQETHLDHIEVLYHLGFLYTRLEGHDWPARRALSLFLTRCKRLKESELKARKLDSLLPKAQEMLDSLDKKLGV